jgi:hypothetical protein
MQILVVRACEFKRSDLFPMSIILEIFHSKNTASWEKITKLSYCTKWGVCVGEKSFHVKVGSYL